MFEKAKKYAYEKHNMPSDCQRYGNLPYSTHLDSVVEVGRKYKHYIKDEDWEDVECALILHDTIEDTDTNPHTLENLFNKRIADIVFRVSNERGWDRKEKNFKTYPKIWVNDLAIFVKLCDRISNTKNSKETNHPVYDVYKKEFPIFKYALKVRRLYDEMWKELEQLSK